MNEFTQIPLDELEIDAWYVGRGRNSNIGQWTGNNFAVIAECMVYTGSVRTVTESQACIKWEPYYTAEEGCFQPFMKIDQGEMIKPFGEDGRDEHYGSTMQFRENV